MTLSELLLLYSYTIWVGVVCFFVGINNMRSLSARVCFSIVYGVSWPIILAAMWFEKIAAEDDDD